MANIKQMNYTVGDSQILNWHVLIKLIPIVCNDWTVIYFPMPSNYVLCLIKYIIKTQLQQ